MLTRTASNFTTPEADPISLLRTRTCNSFAGQGFASGDPVITPFNRPITLQSHDPLTSGTIAVESADVVSTPKPSATWLVLTGLVAVYAGVIRRTGSAGGLA